MAAWREGRRPDEREGSGSEPNRRAEDAPDPTPVHRRDDPDRLHWGRGALVGLIIVLSLVAIAATAVFVLTGTDWGRERVRRYAQNALNGMIHGRATIGRLSGNLLTGMTVHDFAITDSAGKPSPAMYRMAVERLGGSAPLVIGDRLNTDLAGARAGDYPGLHVLTGVSSGRDDVLAIPGERPHYIGADLRSLLVAHPEPVQGPEGWWTCREAAARVVDGRLELARTAGTGVEARVDVIRAACAAAWAAVDAGEVIDANSVPELGVDSDGFVGAAG